ncbi:MAG TPA: hypothetical protein VFG81_14775 [Anaerolineales bacterium]|jgi:hypothetical protein|nr:hypothetical protein [Anaerolineales bacterium]
MEQKKTYAMVSGLLITLFLAACSASPVPPTNTQPTEATQNAATEPASEGLASNTPAAEQSLCTNVYYPVQQGATWTYKSTGGPAGEYSFIDTINAVRADGFTLSTQIGDLTRTQEWTCTPEGLAALQLGGAPAAMLNSQNIELHLDIDNATGLTFPRQISPGSQWQQNMDVTGNVTAFNEQAEATGNVQMSFNAVGNESVTVPAGTFEALKVEVDVTLNVNATYEGITLPVSFTGDYTYWFAPNVGWVKASGTGSVLGNSFTDTTELQSYNIP